MGVENVQTWGEMVMNMRFRALFMIVVTLTLALLVVVAPVVGLWRLGGSRVSNGVQNFVGGLMELGSKQIDESSGPSTMGDL